MPSHQPAIIESLLPAPLRRQALLDTLERTRGGMAIHLPLWILIGLISRLVKTSPVFFWSNIVLFLLFFIARIVLASRATHLSDNAGQITSFAKIFVTLFLGMGVHWGLLAAIATHWSEFEGLRISLWLVVTGMCAAGTTKLAFHRAIRIGFPLVLTVPILLASLLSPPRMNGFVFGGAILLLVYVLDSSRTIYGDYWSAALAHWELERRSLRLQLALEAGNIGICDGDAITGVTHCDERTRDAFGLRRDGEVKLQDLVSGVHPEDRERIENLIQAALNPGGTGKFDAEFRVVGVDDGICRWLIAKGRAAFEKKENTVAPVHFMGIVLDVTEKVLAENELLENQKRYRELLERTTDAVLLVDAEWRFTYLNPNAVRLIANGRDLVGKNLWSEFPDTVNRQFSVQYRNVMSSGHPVRFEEFYHDPINKWFEVHAYSMQEGIAVFFRDTTERRKAEEALIRSEKLAAAGRLAASVSHEINNPLEAVTNLLYLLEKEPCLSQTGHEFLQQAQTELARVSQIAIQTLQFYRQSTNASEVLIEDQLDSILKFYRPRLHATSITVTKRFRHHAPVIAFEGELRQVFTNLIGNAIDALVNSGQLSVRTRFLHQKTWGQDYIAVTIADTGTGMSSFTLANSFEPFFSTKGITGTGLGLWVSKNIIERHGGVIRVRSKDHGSKHGSVFMVWIPILSETKQNSV